MIANKKEILISIKERYCYEVKMGKLLGLCLVANKVLFHVPAKDLYDFKVNFLEVRRPKNLRYITNLLVKGIKKTPLRKFNFICKIEEYAAYWWDLKDTQSRIEFLDEIIDSYTILEMLELIYNYLSLIEDRDNIQGLLKIIETLPYSQEYITLMKFYVISNQPFFKLLFFDQQGILFERGRYADKMKFICKHIDKFSKSLK